MGSKDSGLSVLAQSWEGQVRVTLYENDGKDYARITVEGHNGAGPLGKILADAPFSQLRGD